MIVELLQEMHIIQVESQLAQRMIKFETNESIRTTPSLYPAAMNTEGALARRVTSPQTPPLETGFNVCTYVFDLKVTGEPI